MIIATLLALTISVWPVAPGIARLWVEAPADTDLICTLSAEPVCRAYTAGAPVDVPATEGEHLTVYAVRGLDVFGQTRITVPFRPRLPFISAQ